MVNHSNEQTTYAATTHSAWRHLIIAGVLLGWSALVYCSTRTLPSPGDASADLIHHRLGDSFPAAPGDVFPFFATAAFYFVYVMLPIWVWGSGLFVSFSSVPYVRGQRTPTGMTGDLAVLVVGLVVFGWVDHAHNGIQPIVGLMLLTGAGITVTAHIASYRAWLAFHDSGLISYAFREIDDDHTVVQVLGPGTATTALVRTHGELTTWPLSYDTLASSQELTPHANLAAGRSTVLIERARRDARPTWDNLIDDIAATITSLQTAAAILAHAAPAPGHARAALLQLDRCASLLRPYAQRQQRDDHLEAATSWTQWSARLSSATDTWLDELAQSPVTRDNLTYTQGQTLQALRTLLKGIDQ